VCEGAKLSHGSLTVLSSWVEKWEGCLRYKKKVKGSLSFM
jgi:hypothetical protein